MKKDVLCRIISSALALVMAVAVVPTIFGDEINAALFDQTNEGSASDKPQPADDGDWKKTQANTDLGTRQISKPQKPKTVSSAWRGDYVYFGNYDMFLRPEWSKPLKFRVLSPQCNDFSNSEPGTLFLDCDSALSPDKHNFFDDNEDVKWGDSAIKKFLNGDFYDKVFSFGEKSAIITSSKTNYGYHSSLYCQEEKYGYVNIDDKIFLLDIDELCNPDYGYIDDTGWEVDEVQWIGGKKYYTWTSYDVPNHSKSNSAYWTRAYKSSTDGNAAINQDGLLDVYSAWSNIGVSPALNIDLNEVIFSSVTFKSDLSGSDYKLTLEDFYIMIDIPTGGYPYISDGKIYVPYSIQGSNSDAVTQASVLILDKEYSKGNTNKAKVLYYGALKGDFSKNSTGYFTLPSKLDLNKWGSGYYVYILAEDVNGKHYTDYASSPLLISKPSTKAPVSISLNKDTASVECGKTISLKATVKGSSSSVTWKSNDTKVATVDANGKVTAKMAGTVAITASVAGKTAKCLVTVLYKDVTNSKDFWFAPTNYLTAKGVVKGYDKQTKFKPANDCTRAQMVTFLYRLQGEPKTKSTTCKFKDVKKSDYFFKPVIWAVENGITTGVSKTKFDPQGVCTRAQTVTFLWRMAKKPDPKSAKNNFKDVKSTDYFYKATLWASEKKILAGYSDGTFKPQGKCLRRQMVTFLYKYDKFINGNG